MTSSGDAGASGSGGPEPMELGTASRRTLTRSEYEKLRVQKKPVLYVENLVTWRETAQ